MNGRYSPVQFPALSLGVMAAIIAIVVMTVVAELNGGFKGFLADLTGHHWVSKGVLALGIFLVAWLASALGLKEDSQKTKVWSLVAVVVSLAGIMVIFLFYLGHFLTA